VRYENTVIPLRAAWSSPFVRWQGPAADLNSLDLAEQVTARALAERGVDWPIDELVLGWTIPQKEAFLFRRYGQSRAVSRRSRFAGGSRCWRPAAPAPMTARAHTFVSIS
jgi:hypothetical protein